MIQEYLCRICCQPESVPTAWSRCALPRLSHLKTAIPGIDLVTVDQGRMLGPAQLLKLAVCRQPHRSVLSCCKLSNDIGWAREFRRQPRPHPLRRVQPLLHQVLARSRPHRITTGWRSWRISAYACFPTTDVVTRIPNWRWRRREIRRDISLTPTAFSGSPPVAVINEEDRAVVEPVGPAGRRRCGRWWRDRHANRPG